MPDPGPREERVSVRDWAAVAFLSEAAALLIALAMAFIPGRGGTTWSPADLLWEAPGQLVRVLATFLLVNMLLAVLALGAWGAVRRGGAGPPGR